MMKFGRIAVVSTTALALAATVPTKAEAADLFFPGAYGRVAYGGGGYYGGGLLRRRLRLRSAASALLPSLRSAASAAVLCLWWRLGPRRLLWRRLWRLLWLLACGSKS
jgi:hypothetical protein